MKFLSKQRTIALATLGVFSATIFGGVLVNPTEVHADSKTWKKVAVGAGAVTAYGLVKGKKKVATVGGLVTAGSYLKYRSDKKKENKRKKRYRSSSYRRR
jgi:hypothetical protein